MPLTPNQWNIVLLGHWNPAILTPSGIAKRVFRLAEGTAIEVRVALDHFAPYQVRHNGLSVIPGTDRLMIALDDNTFEQLDFAMELSRWALEDLPKTPVYAVGLNVDYSSDSAITALQSFVSSDLDDKFSDQRMTVSSRSLARAIDWHTATINIVVKVDEGGLSSVTLNFEYKSQSPEKLSTWLKEITGGAIRERVRVIFRDVLTLSAEEFPDA